MSDPGTFVGGFDNNAAPGAKRYWEGRWRDEKAENDRLRAALEEAAASLETLARDGGKRDTLLEGRLQIAGYAANRARVARRALASVTPMKL